MRIILPLLLLLACSLCAAAQASHTAPKLPSVSAAPLDGYSRTADIERRLTEAGPHRIEGLWRIAQSGTTLAIERKKDIGSLPGAEQYQMVIVHSANRAIRPGTVMGLLTVSAKSNVYDASIYTSAQLAGRLSSPKRFTITLAEEDTRLVFKQVKSKYSFNFWRMLPYMFRYSVRTNSNTGEAPFGCVRIFPAPALPSEPRYL